MAASLPPMPILPIDLEKVVSEMLLPMLPLSRFALNAEEERKKGREEEGERTLEGARGRRLRSSLPPPFGVMRI